MEVRMKYYRIGTAWAGAFPDNQAPPVGAVETPTRPSRGTDVWDNQAQRWKRKVSEARAGKREQIDAYRLQLAEIGFSTALFPGKRFQVREEDQSKFLGAAAIAHLAKDYPGQFPWPSDFRWITEDNSQVDIPSADIMLALAAAAFEAVQKVVFTARAHKDALDAIDDSDAIEAYDHTVGWT
jgi:hypothetical protein